MAENVYDITVIGGGIVGLATAMKLAQRYPGLRLLVVEKERAIGRHQTGHNSGVIHAGIYYKPGSLKSQTCVAGRRALLDFCDEHAIHYELCGKVVVASRPEDIPRLEELRRRGTANGVRGLEMIGPERLKEIEPHARGIRALYSPATGIIDFTRVAATYADVFKQLGGEIATSSEVRRIETGGGSMTLATPSGEYRSKYLINCGGLFSDRLARLMTRGGNVGEDLRIIPFRGEYYRLVPERRSLVGGLIYPVPDPRFPFVGVHFTKTIHGEVEVGPNAVLALAREGYRKSDVDLHHIGATLTYRGFWAMAAKYWRMGLEETYRSLFKSAMVRALRELVPEVRDEDLVPSGSGVRAQAVSATGALVDDFVIRQTGNAIHVLNAPSPGATASLAIGENIVDTAAKAFSLAG